MQWRAVRLCAAAKLTRGAEVVALGVVEAHLVQQLVQPHHLGGRGPRQLSILNYNTCSAGSGRPNGWPRSCLVALFSNKSEHRK